MKYVIWILILAVSYFIGVFGFCQVIGSIQHRQRGFLFTIVIWVVILGGIYLLAKFFVPNKLTALYVGYGIALVQSLLAGKIE